MVTTTIVTDEKSLKSCSDSIKNIVKKEGMCSVAFSSQGMKCEDFVLRGLPQNSLFHIWVREGADFTSTTKWLKGEMTFVLDWMQRFFGEQGLVLEAKGEFVELTESQNK
jgi:hypothetical protein